MGLAQLAQGGAQGRAVEGVLNAVETLGRESLLDVADRAAAALLGKFIGAFERGRSVSHALKVGMTGPDCETSEGEAEAGDQGVVVLLARNVSVGGVITQVGLEVAGQGIAEARVPAGVVEAVGLFAPADRGGGLQLVCEGPADAGLGPGPGLGRARTVRGVLQADAAAGRTDRARDVGGELPSFGVRAGIGVDLPFVGGLEGDVETGDLRPVAGVDLGLEFRAGALDRLSAGAGVEQARSAFPLGLAPDEGVALRLGRGLGAVVGGGAEGEGPRARGRVLGDGGGRAGEQGGCGGGRQGADQGKPRLDAAV